MDQGERPIDREGQVRQQLLEVGPRADRVEVGLIAHRSGIAIAGGDGPPEQGHGRVPLGLRLIGREARIRRRGGPG